MASEKITAMPDLAGGQVPTDLVTVVDLSAVPASQNVKSTLNDLFATITKNITDRAVRFQAPGTAPTVSAASQGSIYHNGTTFLASSNGGAYEQVYTLAAQTAALVFAGPTTGGPSIPTFRALALTDLPTQTGTGNIVLATNPVMTNPTINIGITGVSSGRILGFQPVTSGVNYVDVYNAISSAGPTLHAAGTATNIALNLHAKGTGIVACVGNALRITGSTAGSNGIVEARGGTSSGGVLQLYELTTNGTNWVGFRAPDSLAANLEFELPSADGTAGQALITNGAGVFSFSSFAPTANPTFTGVVTVAQGTVTAPSITRTGDTNTGIYFPSADNISFTTGGTLRAQVDSAGSFIIGNGGGSGFTRLELIGPYASSGGVSQGFRNTGTIPSTTTGSAYCFTSILQMENASFNTNIVGHYYANNVTSPGPATVGSHWGFIADLLAIGTVQNIGFFSTVNSAVGPSNYGIWCQGTAQNRFDGPVGIGKNPGADQLSLSLDTARKATTTTWATVSDARVKTVLGNYTKGLAEICQVRPVRYMYNGKGETIADGNEYISILAQELIQIFPECISTRKSQLEPDGQIVDLYDFNSHNLFFAIINAIRELKQELDSLQSI